MHRPSSEDTANLIAELRAQLRGETGKQTSWQWFSTRGFDAGSVMCKIPAGRSIAASRSEGVQRVSHDIPSIPPTDAIPSLRFP